MFYTPAWVSVQESRGRLASSVFFFLYLSAGQNDEPASLEDFMELRLQFSSQQETDGQSTIIKNNRYKIKNKKTTKCWVTFSFKVFAKLFRGVQLGVQIVHHVWVALDQKWQENEKKKPVNIKGWRVFSLSCTAVSLRAAHHWELQQDTDIYIYIHTKM